MRIIKIHISNFGKIHDFDFAFEGNQTIIREDNGWGKSTFAAFIKAMFYGLQGNGRGIETSERKKYSPWQGGAFGGSITFEVDGKRYTLSRIFKDKEANDDFDLRDALTNLKSNDFTANIGQELFKIDCASFEKSVFVGQNSCATETTGDISARIGSIVEMTSDIGDYDKAMSVLVAGQKQYKKGSGRNTGIIDETENAIRELTREIHNSNGIDDALHELEMKRDAEQKLLDAKKNEMEDKSRIQETAAKNQELFNKKKEWLRLSAEKQEAKAGFDEAMELFPKGVPEMSELDEMQKRCMEIKAQETLADANELRDEESVLLGELSAKFAGGYPSDDEIDSKIAEANELVNIRKQHAAGMLTAEENRRFGELKASFENDEYDIDEIIRIRDTRERKKSELKSMKATVNMLMSMIPEPSVKKPAPLVLIAGVLAVLAGIVTVIPGYTLPGVVILAVGLVIAFAGLLIFKKKPEPAEKELSAEIIEAKQNIEAGERELAESEKIISKYMENHGRVFDEANAAAFLQEQKKLSWEFTILSDKKKGERNLPSVGRVVELTQSIKGFLTLYSFAADENGYLNSLHELKAELRSYRELKHRSDNLEAANKNIRKNTDRLENFFGSYGFILDEGIDRAAVVINIAKAVNDLRGRESQYREKADKLAAFEAVNDMAALADIDAAEQVSITEISSGLRQLMAEIEDCRKRILSYNSRIEECQTKYDEREEYKLQKQELEAKLWEQKREYGYYLKAAEHLEKAKERIMTQYTEPVFNGFSKYYEAVTDSSADSCRMDVNSRITLEEAGMQRELAALSCGYRDLIGLSMRISLIDAMYKEEKPVIIMDDPFVNLDDKKTALAIKLLERISENYQLIYLTCSSSRC
ncbi:MAG: AAA family ATPase [Lachnospiraceae bacterium]|nr:AAA family ATPase [Lachnospiraceae bacterium]